MEQTWLMIGIGALGLIVGASATLAFRISERAQSRQGRSLRQPGGAGEDVSALLSALTSISVLLGPDNEVLRATAEAYSSGLVRRGHLVHERIQALVARARSSGTSEDEEITVPRSMVPGSDRLTFGLRAAPLSGGRVLVLADDHTAGRRVEEVRRDFVANVSHELKTPVGAIALLAETVADAADDPSAVRQFSLRMQREAIRLSELVQEIIELSRLQAPEHEITFVHVRLQDVVAEAMARVELQAQEARVKIVAGPVANFDVLGDQALLTTALRNLLDNAVRYSRAGGQVSVGTRIVGDVAEIAVVDQGIGMTAEQQERVFERFYRVDSARSRANGGTGLGLSIVKHVAANHGGEVRVWSAPNRGSTFTLRVPLADRQATVSKRQPIEGPGL